MTLMQQLIQFHKSEPWQSQEMTDFQIMEYFGELIEKGRLIICAEDNIILGYCEFSRINLSQLGYLVLAQDYPTTIWDDGGMIIWVANMHIHSDYQNVGVLQYFKRHLFRLNPECEFIAGRHQGKRLKPIAIFRNRVVREVS